MRLGSAAELRESPDSRRESRLAAQVNLSLAPAEDLTDTTQAASVNLSLSGLCARTERRYRVGQGLVLHVALGRGRLDVRGVVVWSGPQTAELGTRLVDLSEDACSRLEAVLWILAGLETSSCSAARGRARRSQDALQDCHRAGGQPGTATSTGITLATRPTLA